MSDILLLERIKNYKENHCYQYQKRIDTYEQDKQLYGWTDEDISNIKLEDFTFNIATSKEEKKEISDFICRYEWLGNLSQFPTHYFAARYKGILGGVVIIGMPNAFSKLLGDNTKEIERLIQRGASASWTPKNLASKFLSWCLRWMVDNTQYRLFTAFSDTMAKEVGTIYQSLNFYYLGKKSGTSIRCINPYNKNVIISDRTFRVRSFYKRYAKDLNIEWQKNWASSHGIIWKNIPEDIADKLKAYSKEMYNKAQKIYFPHKHKYAFVLGKNKKETRELREKFLKKNKIFPYPKER